ncbi:hypothetical protein [Mannheimia pernigra]|uniref:Uncharacterized protein n=1 Tax=Mannheimia pernigra TaxID=111844 RepID=A0A7D5DYV6_9PAST|nr:hypothetical protein [Mannheimia pernigra]QLB40843.1 hypothetical protein HV559_08160 [Mannheimia pernigra]
MTDTERLDFLEKQKIETRWSEIHEQWVLGTYEGNGGFFHWARNPDLRTAIDETAREMRGFGNDRN